MSREDRRCRDCNHWWADHNEDDTCALCGCDWFQQATEMVARTPGIEHSPADKGHRPGPPGRPATHGQYTPEVAEHIREGR